MCSITASRALISTPMLLAVLVVSLLTSTALANPPDDVQEPDPHSGSGTWLTKPPGDQAADDPQIPPAATGAIFVPAMTSSRQEPSYIVQTPDGVRIGETQHGRKTWVTPGTYHVLVGSGVPEGRLKFEVMVVEGRTTFVPVEWGALTVNVVNQRGTPFRGSFELVRLPQREVVGLGIGADVAQGEEVDTWVLRPGKYMILAAGESYRARKNFATLRLPPGELVRYTLVLDEGTGDILGAGELGNELDSGVEGPWTISMLIGGSVAFNHTQNTALKAEGMTLDLSAFYEAVGGYRDPQHIAYARLYAEIEGTLDLDRTVYLSVVDELNLDTLYMYRLVPWFGPYVRVSATSHMAPSLKDFDEPTTVIRQREDGSEVGREGGLLEAQVAPVFDPIDLRYGTGVRFDTNPVYWFQLTSRIGLGARHFFTRDFYETVSIENNEAILRRRGSVHRFGAEASLVTDMSLTRWIFLKMEADLFIPFPNPGEGSEAVKPVVDFRPTLTLRLTSFASLNYTLRLELDPAKADDVQIDQALLLRFAYKIL